jgi:hypothetical protein
MQLPPVFSDSPTNRHLCGPPDLASSSRFGPGSNSRTVGISETLTSTAAVHNHRTGSVATGGVYEPARDSRFGRTVWRRAVLTPESRSGSLFSAVGKG